MSVEMDKAFNASDTQTRLLAQKKRDLENEKQGLEYDKAQAAAQRSKTLQAEKEKTDRAMVEISREADNQISTSKKLHADRLHSLNENSQKHYEEIAGRTADEIRRVNESALKTINDRKAESMERVRFVTDRTEDPFYRVRSLNPVMTENEKEFRIQLSLPEHEAKNLLVTGDGAFIKLTLARRFEDSVKGEPGSGRSTRTAAYQSVVEQLAVPSAYDAKKIQRDFKDGVVTIVVPKAVFGLPDESPA